MLKGRHLSVIVIVGIACFATLWLINNLSLQKIVSNKIKHEATPLLSLIDYPGKNILSWKNGIATICDDRYLVKVKENGIVML